jgi:quinol monooxygenase YgiN
VTEPPTPAECAVVELRQYTLHPGRRDELIELFEREFIESQESTGMCLLGLFRDADRDERFVWIRGFRDMEERLAALQAFYGGPAWRQHSDAANVTMVDVSDVLLLRPLDPIVMPEPARRPTAIASIAHVAADSTAEQCRLVAGELAGGASWSVRLATLHAPNSFAALPVREDAEVVVVLSDGVTGLPQIGAAKIEYLRLAPTARSRLR